MPVLRATNGESGSAHVICRRVPAGQLVQLRTIFVWQEFLEWGMLMVATVHFLSDWSQQQVGDIRAGEPLLIDYDPQRLPHCRSYRHGQPSWSVVVYLRFHPGGQTESGRVAPGPELFKVTVPGDARKIEIWFNNTDQSGCSSWDSQYGQNYWLDTASSE